MKQSKPLQGRTEQDLFRSELLKLVEAMVVQSKQTHTFDANHWLRDWLKSSVPALGNRCPTEFLNTSEGRELVQTLLIRMQSGAFS
ncbi:MbcA/ParS/Xre antitoxin family protein [Herbaspirillum sp. meg3]|uniref:MbcA/ParS/Xre antitoxin family protein n=1 Tax=Herbaspirillum sp. meg3 TaxID=2025949 RepID=UPI0012FD8558|nr:MbcA/ParS/Xre antitoxin family protein [Herbaspirillum sp. meg3]